MLIHICLIKFGKSVRVFGNFWFCVWLAVREFGFVNGDEICVKRLRELGVSTITDSLCFEAALVFVIARGRRRREGFTWFTHGGHDWEAVCDLGSLYFAILSSCVTSLGFWFYCELLDLNRDEAQIRVNDGRGLRVWWWRVEAIWVLCVFCLCVCRSGDGENDGGVSRWRLGKDDDGDLVSRRRFLRELRLCVMVAGGS